MVRIRGRYSYKIGGKSLEVTRVEKDVGITIKPIMHLSAWQHVQRVLLAQGRKDPQGKGDKRWYEHVEGEAGSE